MSDPNRLARKNKLDDAIRDYFQAGVDDGSLGSGGYVVGWTVAIAATRMIDGEEADGFMKLHNYDRYYAVLSNS